MRDIEKKRELKEDIENLMAKEEIMWAQKVRSDWIVKGDRNTKYFQTIVKQRRARNRILHLKCENGNLTDNIDEIGRILVDHFRHRFTETNPSTTQSILKELRSLPIPKLNQNQQLQLDSPFTDAEIELAVFQLGSHKSPGPDGILAFFYQEYWNIVKEDILDSIHAFFHSGTLLKSLNKTFITLVPKISVPEEVSHFRPISLCNVTYKFISKVMVSILNLLWIS